MWLHSELRPPPGERLQQVPLGCGEQEELRGPVVQGRLLLEIRQMCPEILKLTASSTEHCTGSDCKRKKTLNIPILGRISILEHSVKYCSIARTHTYSTECQWMTFQYGGIKYPFKEYGLDRILPSCIFHRGPQLFD